MDENVPQSNKEAAIAEAYAAYLIALASRTRAVEVPAADKQARLGSLPQPTMSQIPQSGPETG